MILGKRPNNRMPIYATDTQHVMRHSGEHVFYILSHKIPPEECLDLSMAVKISKTVSQHPDQLIVCLIIIILLFWQLTMQMAKLSFWI